MDYLIRFRQVHETFRKPEIQAIAALYDIDLEFVFYKEDSPFCIVRLPSESAARTLISRSILAQGIYELWGHGTCYESLHASIRSTSASQWPQYKDHSFKFIIDGYRGKRDNATQRTLIESFSYLGFEGPIIMSNPRLSLCVFEEYEPKAPEPFQLYLGRFVAPSARLPALNTYDLKKRTYISTTSMDSELALVTANITLAGPGKLFYDPFMGTGSFPVACAHFGAIVVGSDIDGRSIRGKDDRNVMSNFEQYKLTAKYLDSFISDLTNTPLRISRLLDGIICDPPYGVREGLKVLGRREGEPVEELKFIDGTPAHLRDGYIPPKRPYSFEAMLDDILEFGARTLVPNGCLSMWMPTANDADMKLAIPAHSAFELVSVCVQPFNKWSRRLLTYRLIPSAVSSMEGSAGRKREYNNGVRADDLNDFRRKYFQGFKTPAVIDGPSGSTPPSSEGLS